MPTDMVDIVEQPHFWLIAEQVPRMMAVFSDCCQSCRSCRRIKPLTVRGGWVGIAFSSVRQLVILSSPVFIRK